MNLIAPIRGFLVAVLLYIFRLTSFAFRRLRFAGEGVAIEDKVTDFMDIFKTTRIFFVFNILALLVFTLLPQGKDIILIVIEDLSGFHIWSLLSLLAGLLGWCMVSEFGARYKIYITDNSGLSLTDERIIFRKEAQRSVSYIYLLLPIVIVMLSVIIVSVSNIQNWELRTIWPFTLILILLILSFALLSKFYLDSYYISQLRKKAVWYKVRDEELNWANKLFGIYNDYVFMVRKETNFKDATTVKSDGTPDPPPNANLRTAYENFTKLIKAFPPKGTPGAANTIENFPRDFLKENELAPYDFTEINFSPDNYRPKLNPDYAKDKTQPEFIKEINPDGYFRWIYKNNPEFYKTLHLQVKVIAASSLLFMLLISVNSSFRIYQVIGAPALVCLSFACWLGIYTGLLYIDARYRRKIKISLRWGLVFWALINSFINNDHPVRNNGDTGFSKERPTLSEHFDSWTQAHLPIDTAKISVTDTSKIKDSALVIEKDTTFYPVYFITAEGGALRTGAFAALLLAKLQDSFPEFKDHIYAFSTVSGGSVGVSFFNAITYLEPNNNAARTKNYYSTVTRRFFEQDQLSPTLAKLFYADLLNIFWPRSIELFDRAISLEKSWEQSYHNVFSRAKDRNIYSSNFLSGYDTQKDRKKVLPAWFINTTEVETGLQCYISNVRADSFVLARQRDLLAEKIRYGINYSTAINFSSRFPLFSPSAALYQDEDRTFHYVDGGYVENTGAKTMLEILQNLHGSIIQKNIIPYVIQIKFSETDSTRFEKTGFMNEISSIVSGIYNTRGGSSVTNTELLKKEVAALHGQFIEVPLTASSRDVPMSWVFSKRSLDKLNSAVYEVMTNPLNDLHTWLPDFRKDKPVGAG